MGAPTRALLDEAGVEPGSVCVDLGCGGGDVSLELARRVGPSGRVLGLDRDEAKIAIARSETAGLTNLEFRACDVMTWAPGETYDLAYARFLFSHIHNPAQLLRVLHRALRPGGSVVIEDVDFRGHFCEPPNEAYDRYVQLYIESVQRRGGNAVIGPLLPELLGKAGFSGVHVRVSHPVAMVGGIKALSSVTFENIADALLADGSMTAPELADTAKALRILADDPHTLGGGPRVFQVWGTA